MDGGAILTQAQYDGKLVVGKNQTIKPKASFMSSVV